MNILFKQNFDNEMVEKFLETEQLADILHDRMLYLMEEKFTVDYFQQKN